jgi:hypothetical protein
MRNAVSRWLRIDTLGKPNVEIIPLESKALEFCKMNLE